MVDPEYNRWATEILKTDKTQFETGAQRDDDEGKPRPDFIDPRFLLRVGEFLVEGAKHYGDFNFDKGIPSQRYMAAALRHLLKYYAGQRDEDHLSAVVFNIQGLAMNEGTELDDLHRWRGTNDGA